MRPQPAPILTPQAVLRRMRRGALPLCLQWTVPTNDCRVGTAPDGVSAGQRPSQPRALLTIWFLGLSGVSGCRFGWHKGCLPSSNAGTLSRQRHTRRETGSQSHGSGHTPESRATEGRESKAPREQSGPPRHGGPPCLPAAARSPVAPAFFLFWRPWRGIWRVARLPPPSSATVANESLQMSLSPRDASINIKADNSGVRQAGDRQDEFRPWCRTHW